MIFVCHPFMHKGRSGATCRPWKACVPPPVLAHKRVWFVSSALGKEALISGNRADTFTAVAVVVARARAAGIEVQDVGVVRNRRELRGRPVGAERKIFK